MFYGVGEGANLDRGRWTVSRGRGVVVVGYSQVGGKREEDGEWMEMAAERRGKKLGGHCWVGDGKKICECSVVVSSARMIGRHGSVHSAVNDGALATDDKSDATRLSPSAVPRTLAGAALCVIDFWFTVAPSFFLVPHLTCVMPI